MKSATVQGGPHGLVYINTDQTLVVDDQLQNGATYYYVVSSVNDAGEGPDSAEVSATPRQ
ncbi:MAG: hypothetical protein HY716_04120 [Planctomycetes bacterium]|nr:hypothetical protein [Planctomycetota bacterium]